MSVIRYVERNPVRAGMVERAEEYPWSSAAVHLEMREEPRGLLDLNWWKQRWTRGEWAENLGGSEEEDELAAIRRATYTGRPWGSRDFVTELEKRLGRRLAAFGRPARSTSRRIS